MTSPRGGSIPSEVEELNRILEVERRLVLSTQQNYRLLKEQHLQLAADLEAVTRDRDTVSLPCYEVPSAPTGDRGVEGEIRAWSAQCSAEEFGCCGGHGEVAFPP